MGFISTNEMKRVARFIPKGTKEPNGIVFKVDNYNVRYDQLRHIGYK